MDGEFVDLVESAKGASHRFILWPDQWNSFNSNVLLNWQTVKFDRTNQSTISNTPGVYAFLIQPRIASNLDASYLIYIGITDRTLQVRFKEYIQEMAKPFAGRPKIVYFLTKYQNFMYFSFSEIQDSDVLKELENSLLETFIPPANSQFPATISNIIRAF